LPGIPIVRCPADAALDEGPLAPAFDTLRAYGFAIDVTRRHFALELPHEARCGYDLLVNGEPFRMLLCADESIAQDELLWTGHAMQTGVLVLVSTPPLYSDWTNTRRYSASAIKWSTLIDHPALRQSLTRAAQRVDQQASNEAVPNTQAPNTQAANTQAAPLSNLTSFVESLRARGLRVVVRRAAYRGTLPVGARAGMFVEIEGDPFTVLRFESAASAAAGNPLPDHSVSAGHLVAHSDPPDIYANKDRGTQRRPDAAISWSPLLASESFRTAVLAAADPGRR
jgi:hypothetical protein